MKEMYVMEWLFKGIIIWLSVDAVLIATIWYLSITLSQLWPDWWRRVIVDSIEADFPEGAYTYAYEIESVDLYAVELKSDSALG
jgi:hypothetical protein